MTSTKTNCEIQLLYDTQSYLKSMVEQNVPDTLLVSAWEQFYGIYDDLIRRFVIAQGVPRSDVDDCVQDVWSEVLTRLSEFEHRDYRPGLRAWLFTLVRSTAANIFRGKSRRDHSSLEQAKAAGQEPSQPQADPAILDEQQRSRALLASVFVRLRRDVSDVNYWVLWMRSIEGRDVQDVASSLNLTAQQVRYRHHRMIRKLRGHASSKPSMW